ncbi:MAG: S8 family serine peptidase [Raineya sp.]|jgi:subtilisin family serine protease|nr:S8 family serine peptidase [Raineya sp.]
MKTSNLKLTHKNYPILMLFMLVASAIMAQTQEKYYFIPFKDKQGIAYNISEPQNFLSKKALDRRKKQNIEISSEDLPVNMNYVAQIKTQGAKIHQVTKWFNGVVVLCNETVLGQIKALNFVKAEEIKMVKNKPTTESEDQKENKRNYKSAKKTTDFTKGFEFDKTSYGYSYTQNQMIGVDEMHKKGFWGEGMIMAVFDSGFSDADKQTYFKHLFENGQILDTYDFVMNERSVFEDDDHGRMVLSCIAAYEKGKIVGTAPKTQFYLFRTEDVNTEYMIEEYNWLTAAEKADSLGVDIISSSLGYTNFDDKTTSYKTEQMDGKTCIATRAAEIAAQKGMVVVSSAGNEGGSAWNIISSPADAASILSIGAVNSRGGIVYFSSRGYTADGRVKPDVLAMGSSATVGGSNSEVSFNNGTSFSCPIMAGLVAGFWQANPQLTAKQVVEYIRKSGNQYSKPDNTYGYGIASFTRADYLAKKETTTDGIMTGQNPNEFKIYPNPYKPDNKETIPAIAWGANYRGKNIEINVYDSKSKLISLIRLKQVGKETILEDLKNLPRGEYILTVSPNLSPQPSLRFIIE